MMFKEYDPVKITSLREPDRHFDGTQAVARAPRVGDTGLVVAISGKGDDRTYVVESVDLDGMTIWLADFHADELEKGDESIKENCYIPVLPKIPTYLLAGLLGSITAYLIASLWLGLSPWWAALPLGAIGALFGVFMLENIGEAIVFTGILFVLMAVLITAVPGFAILKAAVIPLACGLSVGKFVVGIWKEVSR